MTTVAQKRGAEGEELAVAYLQQHHYLIIERNFKACGDEIDIIARDGKELVFVEVKYRTTFIYGEPEQFVTESKQMKLRRAAATYVQFHVKGLIPCRFDIVAISKKEGKIKVRHLRSAFGG